MTIWTREEQRQRELRERADARYQRLVRLNTAQVNAAESDARLEQLERARLRNEAAARRERIAAWEAQQAQRKRAETPRTRTQSRTPTAEDYERWAAQGRAAWPQQNITRRSDTGKRMVKIERRAFNEAGQLMSDWVEVDA